MILSTFSCTYSATVMSSLENYFQSSIRFHSNCFLTLELYEFFILNINPLSEVITILKHLIWLNHIKYHIVKTVIKNCQFYNIQLYISTWLWEFWICYSSINGYSSESLNYHRESQTCFIEVWNISPAFRSYDKDWWPVGILLCEFDY